MLIDARGASRGVHQPAFTRIGSASRLGILLKNGLQRRKIKEKLRSYPVMPSKFIADGLATGSEDAMKLFSANQHQMNTTVSRLGTKASKTP